TGVPNRPRRRVPVHRRAEAVGADALTSMPFAQALPRRPYPDRRRAPVSDCVQPNRAGRIPTTPFRDHVSDRWCEGLLATGIGAAGFQGVIFPHEDLGGDWAPTSTEWAKVTFVPIHGV